MQQSIPNWALSKSALYLLAAASTPPEVIDAVAERSERRNITAGQKAMAWAMLFPKPEKLKRKGDVPEGTSVSSHSRKPASFSTTGAACAPGARRPAAE